MALLTHIPCLDKGYVNLISWLPWSMADLYEAISSGNLDEARAYLDQDDLNVVNAARASLAKQSRFFSDADRRLIHFLARQGHQSPFYQGVIKLEIKAPLLVARQWETYKVGSDHTATSGDIIGQFIVEGVGLRERNPDPFQARNESSRRYVTHQPEFYLPRQWRGQPSSQKQGSQGLVDAALALELTEKLTERYQQALADYQEALDKGVAPEQARLFLPGYSLYIYWQWLVSLEGVIHFLNQRLASEAQEEIQVYARAVWELVSQQAVYPLSIALRVRNQ